MKTVLVGGCSHSAPYFVKEKQTWPLLLKKKYSCNLIKHTITGVGNLFIIDHLMWELHKAEVDLVIFQVTEQFRTVLGINHSKLLGKRDGDFKEATSRSLNFWYNAHFWEKYSSDKYLFDLDPDKELGDVGPSRYTSGEYPDEFDDMKNTMLDDFPDKEDTMIYDSSYYEIFDTFWRQQIQPSVYETQVRYLRELYLLERECELKKVPILFIEWWKPLLKMNVRAVKFYYDKLNRDRFVEFDYDKNWFEDSEHFGKDGCHFNEKGHQMFFRRYIEPNLPIKL